MKETRNEGKGARRKSGTPDAPTAVEPQPAANLPAPVEWVHPSDLPAVAAGLVHEVKNPLAAMHMHLQLLEGYITEVTDPELREKMNRKVGVLKREITNLNQSLQDFIRLIRAEKNQALPTVDFSQVVGDVVGFLEPQASREGVEIQFLPGKIDEPVRVDRSFVRQIVMNLVLNSIQAFEKCERPEGERRVTVTTGMRRPFFFVRVSDNGPGIPEDLQNRIFDPFYSTKERGSGLGLALVQRMIAAMGGHVEVESRPGEGTDFTVLLGGPGLLAQPDTAQQ